MNKPIAIILGGREIGANNSTSDKEILLLGFLHQATALFAAPSPASKKESISVGREGSSPNGTISSSSNEPMLSLLSDLYVINFMPAIILEIKI